MQKIKITHIITGLNMGGAETMLYKLLKHIDKDKYDVNVISMMDDGVYGEKIRNLGFEVISLNMKKGIPSFKFKLAKRHIKNTDIIQTWMYHADLLGYILFKFSKVEKLIWGIRRSNLDPKLNKKSTIIIAKINAKLSKKVDTIVSCSTKAKEVHEEFGFFDENLLVIPNGFELNQFSKDVEAKLKLSKIIGRKSDIPYIAHVGRWSILKDYQNFIKALNKVKQQGIKFHAVLVGTNIDEKNMELMDLVKKYDLLNNVSLLGIRDDIPTIMSGADILTSSSSGEGFPNVIGEAMACETPCVVTDVGDSAYIVGDTGKVVPSKDSDALSKSILDLLHLPDNEREHLGSIARQRVIENFDIHKVTKQFEELYNL
ncbi:glycosyltransferase involved in cell wall biosynthesis [Virgibacillus natechei]|uniref:Glycosyltransferase involved in cell wall biosynthesis n=1 Tax=Virgibacillus natechei TaxID=1216297 RepID=A0ABS4IE27_9BACI|nr:glycosyltransferase [Virgibacillus natechei]MBP1969192.1 glycosyltransferase involved in cell wall biosynthesis [Virgibacillus natechei]UZD12358.1 glycosyltransferase [Virgibacillus natechei]